MGKRTWILNPFANSKPKRGQHFLVQMYYEQKWPKAEVGKLFLVSERKRLKYRIGAQSRQKTAIFIIRERITACSPKYAEYARQCDGTCKKKKKKNVKNVSRAQTFPHTLHALTEPISKLFSQHTHTGYWIAENVRSWSSCTEALSTVSS